MPDIFLSYNREDQARAKLFAEAFERQGFKVWWDVGLKAGEAYDDAAEVINRANKFGLGKDVLPFALIGAAVAIPIPFIGPIIGGAIGAAIGVWRGNNRVDAAPDAATGAIEATPTSVKSKPRNQDVVAELIRFGDLRDKGLITQAEFDVQKARLLGDG